MVNEALRAGIVNGWKGQMKMEYLQYLRETHGFDWYTRRWESDEIRRDADAIADVMHCVYHCDWGEWNQGSMLFFWRWHPEFKCAHVIWHLLLPICLRWNVAETSGCKSQSELIISVLRN